MNAPATWALNVTNEVDNVELSMGSPNVAFKVNLGSPRKSTINRKSQRSNAIALPCARVRRGGATVWGSQGQAGTVPSRVPTVPEGGASVPHSQLPHAPPRTPRWCSRAWWVGPGFRRGHPEKLKTWKPDMFHDVAAPQNPRFPEFQDFTPTTGTRGGHPCPCLRPSHALRLTSSWPR